MSNNLIEDIEEAFNKIVEADTNDFVELARILDIDVMHDLAGKDISSIEFNDKDLSGIDLSFSKAVNANFKRAILLNANFKCAYLGGANFNKANLEGAVFVNSYLKKSVFKHARLSGAQFQEAHISHAKFQHAQLRGANFQGAILNNANFQDAELNGANLKYACLKNATLTGAIFKEVNFLGSDLSGAMMDENILDSVNFQDCNIDPETKWVFKFGTEISSLSEMEEKLKNKRGEASTDQPPTQSGFSLFEPRSKPYRSGPKNIYVENLPWSADDATLADLFSNHGEVISARVITDRETGRSRGFGFVEMDEACVDAAISALNGFDIGGRPLKVKETQSHRSRRKGNDDE